MQVDEKLQKLIDQLGRARMGDYGKGQEPPDPRAVAITELKKLGPPVVPALVKRLEDLLAATAAHRERVAAELAWHEEDDRLRDEYGFGVDLEPYRTIPRPLPENRPFPDLSLIKAGIIEALVQFGDQRAAPVLTAALSDPECIPWAAKALCDIHSDEALPVLLEAVTLIDYEINTSLVFDPVLAALQHYGVTLTLARERFEAESSPLGRVRLMHLMMQLPDDGTSRPADSEIRDSLLFLALTEKGPSGWSAARKLEKANLVERKIQIEPPDEDDIFDSYAHRALNEMENHEKGELPADIVRAAIIVAAHGNPPGYDYQLRRRLRHIASTRSVAQAVESILTQDSPDPDDEELRLALELARTINTAKLSDHMRLVRALYRMSSRSKLRDRSLRVLFRKDVLFRQMVQDDDTTREEALAIFEATASPKDRAEFQKYRRSSSQRGWSKLVQLFRRR